MNAKSVLDNLRFQAQHHPLASRTPSSRGEFVLSLMHAIARDHAAALVRGRRTLDVGCNDGHGTSTLAAGTARMVGADVSGRALGVARRTFPRLDLVHIDGWTLPFLDSSFDVVTCLQVLEHVADVHAFLEEIRRVLTPGGAAIFSTPNGSVRLDRGMKPWNPFHVREYSADELRHELRRVFPVVTVRGLMAAPELCRIERARVQRALKRTRAMADSGPGAAPLRIRLTALMKRALSPAVLERLRHGRRFLASRLPASAAVKPLDASFAERWTLRDLFYVDDPDRLDDALDLFAECQRQ